MELPSDIPVISKTVVHDGFSVYVSGSVESAQLVGSGAALCAYDFTAGDDWTPQEGEHSGESQVAQNRNVSQYLPSVVWNFPIQASFTSTNVYGWPRLTVQVRDASRVIQGYCSTYIPTTSGRFVRYCELFTPKSSSKVHALLATLRQEPPEYFDHKLPTTGEGRHATRTRSGGTLKLVLTVKVTKMNQLGYETPFM